MVIAVLPKMAVQPGCQIRRFSVRAGFKFSAVRLPGFRQREAIGAGEPGKRFCPLRFPGIFSVAPPAAIRLQPQSRCLLQPAQNRAPALVTPISRAVLPYQTDETAEKGVLVQSASFVPIGELGKAVTFGDEPRFLNSSRRLALAALSRSILM